MPLPTIDLAKQDALHSELDDIPGIGTQRKTQLLRHFGSLKQVREASCAELSTVPGIPQSVARAVYEYFHATPVAEDETRQRYEDEQSEEHALS